jgi:hypothetical protein
MNFLELLGEGVETTTVANVKTGKIADKVIILGQVSLSAKNTSKIENIDFDLACACKKGKSLFSVSNALRERFPELEEEKTGFNQYYKAGENLLYISICTADDSKPAAQQPLFYNRKRGEVKGSTFTAASLSYYAERAGLMSESEDGTTYFKLVPATFEVADENGIITNQVIEKLFILTVASVNLQVTASAVAKVVEPSPVVSTRVPEGVIETVAPEVVTLVQEVVEVQPIGEGEFTDSINDLMAEIEQTVN